MRREDNVVVLCCRGKKGCPTITETESGIEIRDDYDGKVELTNEEADMLLEYFKQKENFIHE